MSSKAKRECSKTNMITINICIYQKINYEKRARSNVRIGGHSESFSHNRHGNQQKFHGRIFILIVRICSFLLRFHRRKKELLDPPD